MANFKVVLIRHGESEWNKKNIFTGWYDPDLTKKGLTQAKQAGQTLKKKNYEFDVVFTNLHKRTLKTLKTVLNILGLKIPIKKTWRLNERHYGALIGLNKSKTAQKYGDEQVHLWRRSYDVRPPALERSDKRYKAIAKMYKGIPRKNLPLRESLSDTYKRTVPYWNKEIVPEIKKGKQVLIVASHNSLRSLVKYLDKISDKRIPNFTIPTGIPLVYELDKNMKPKKHYYLGDTKKIKKLLAVMAAHGKAKKR
jgi:2,3-bisphosphoglycerate-dependent phosphoglycerate mutase